MLADPATSPRGPTPTTRSRASGTTGSRTRSSTTAAPSTTGGTDVADAANELLPEVERITKPGDRLFVGPTDLRKTPYSDAYLYYMLPDLDPATYFIEMDPGVANREGSRLADDLRSADVAILSSVWNDWDEPNDARKVGPNEPNRVLRNEFCLVDTYGEDGLYELYRRCDRAD